jgi:hypothetical protein
MKRKPRRFQRKRVKGWRMPHGGTCVTRPHKFGNPYSTAKEFRDCLAAIDNGLVKEPTSPEIERMLWIHRNVKKLRGFDLGCFCPLDADCHADELLQRANH